MNIQIPTKTPPRKPLGQWLIDNMPRGIDLEIPGRHESGREIPFIFQIEDRVRADDTAIH